MKKIIALIVLSILALNFTPAYAEDVNIINITDKPVISSMADLMNLVNKIINYIFKHKHYFSFNDLRF